MVRFLPVVGAVMIVAGLVVALAAARAVEVERFAMEVTGQIGAPASQGWVSVGVILTILGAVTLIVPWVIRRTRSKAPAA